MKFFLYVIYFFVFSSLGAKAESCTKLDDKNGAFNRARFIKSPGSYCLTKDIYQPDKSFFAWESSGGGAYTLLEIRNLNGNFGDQDNQIYDINLSGYTLKFESTGIQGVSSYGITKVKIRNGSIANVLTGIGFSGGLLQTTKLGNNEISFADFEDFLPSQTLETTPPVYKKSDYLVEKLNIQAGYRGIVLGGGNNIIRNSTIEVDAHTAIYMYGPNPIIENNTIIIHGKGKTNPNFKEDGIKILDGAIKLRDAKGGIIRNNRIIYKGGFLGFGKAPVAINLLDSKDVLIENNTIEGFKALVRQNGDTSITENSNTLK